MVQDTIITKALSHAERQISTDRSRCVRMRFNKSDCSICTASCKSGAISINGGIAVNAGKCTECMLCVSGCPSGCFTAKDDNFPGLLSQLKNVQDSLPFAVLGCKHARNAEANVKTCCLGSLSEEQMIALTAHLAKPLFLNLIACAGCRNAFIVRELKERVQLLGMKLSFDIGGRLLLIENKAELVFEDVPLDRRGFFQALKTMGLTKVAGLIDTSDNELPLSYSAKRLPVKREALNTVVRKLAESRLVAEIMHAYAFTVKAGPRCADCSACIGMCPTGALKIENRPEGRGLQFNSSLCTGCGLCGEFCPLGAMSISPGFFGRNYFDHASCNADGLAGHDAASKKI